MTINEQDKKVKYRVISPPSMICRVDYVSLYQGLRTKVRLSTSVENEVRNVRAGRDDDASSQLIQTKKS